MCHFLGTEGVVQKMGSFVTDQTCSLLGGEPMEHDLVLTCKDGSTRNFRLYGRPAPCLGDAVTLPIGGELVSARIVRIRGMHFVGSVDPVEGVNIKATKTGTAGHRADRAV
jgi:hypothetical protein